MKVSEIFYALQGEGPSIGRPSVFLRVSSCNFLCTWCDSVEQWKSGVEMTSEAIFEKITELAGIKNLEDGRVHVVITGGEPLIPKHTAGLKKLLTLLAAIDAFVEVETNGSYIDESLGCLQDAFEQVNCSPKLSSSGEPASKRIVPGVLAEIDLHRNSCFKFVVTCEADWEEIERDFLPHISRDKVVLMPAALTREELIKNSAWVWELATQKKVRATTRMHVVAFDSRKGV